MAKLPNSIELELNELTAIFGQTGNPGAAWVAFHYATKNLLPVPGIVAAEIERFAAEISEPLLAAWDGDHRAKLIEKTITKAWGCKKGTEFAQALRRERRAGSIAFEYWEKISNGVSPTTAIWELKDNYNLSDKSIESILTAARKTRDANTPEF